VVLFSSFSPPLAKKKQLFVCTKKALHVELESPLTDYEYIAIYMTLERAERPSGFAEPSTLTGQSPVLGSLYLII
jgi:hypothetical protein